MKDDATDLSFILQCIEDIGSFIENDPEWWTRKRTLFAVERALQVMAESTQRLSPELRRAHPDVPWPAIAGFRNVLVHDYFGVDPLRVEEVVRCDLPPFEGAVRAIRSGLDGDPGGPR